MYAALVLLYTPSAKDMKITFENYVDEWTRDEQKENATLLILASNWMLGLAEPVPSHSWGISVREFSIVSIFGWGTERNKPSQLTQKCLLVNRFCLKNGWGDHCSVRGCDSDRRYPRSYENLRKFFYTYFYLYFQLNCPASLCWSP